MSGARGALGASTGVRDPSDDDPDLRAIVRAWPRLGSEHRGSLAVMAADWARLVPGLPARSATTAAAPAALLRAFHGTATRLWQGGWR